MNADDHRLSDPGRDRALALYEWAAQRFADLFDCFPVSCFTVDEHLNVMEWNASATNLYETTPDQAMTTSVMWYAFRGQCPSDVEHRFKRCLAGDVFEDWERSVMRPDGSVREVRTHMRSLLDQRQRPVGVLVADMDVTEARRLERELDQSRRFLSQVMDTVPDVVYVFDLEENCHTYTNRSLYSFFGYPATSMTGQTDFIRALIHADDWKVLNEHFKNIKKLEDGEIAVVESRILHADGTWHVVRSKDSVFGRDAKGRVKQLLGCMQDVTRDRQMQDALNSQVRAATDMMEQLQEKQKELRQANKQLEELAITDAVTGVANHRHFQERIVEAMSGSTVFSVMIFDVDDFKAYNDEFGHVMGDEALRKVGQALLEVSNDQWTVARYGGEEFAVILPNVAESDAHWIAEQFRTVISSIAWPSKTVTASFGVATWDGAESKKDLIARADVAMYASKAAGKNRVTSYSQVNDFRKSA